MTHVPELAVYGLPILMAMSAGIAFGAAGATAVACLADRAQDGCDLSLPGTDSGMSCPHLPH